MTSVSVVIPTRDRHELLARSVRTARAQRDVEVEVVVVDDGSASPVELVGSDAVLVRHERSRGLARARNAGVARASCEWVAFLDDDDVWAPGKLAAQLAALAERGDFSYGAAIAVDEGGVVLERFPSPSDADLRRLVRRVNAVPAGGSNVLASADLVRSLGGFDERFDHLADWDLWWRLCEAGEARPVSAELVAYVQHLQAMHVASLDGASGELRALRRKHRRGALPAKLDRGELHRWMARGHQRAGQRSRSAWHWTASAAYARDAERLRLGADALVRRRPEDRRRVGGTAPAWVRAALELEA